MGIDQGAPVGGELAQDGGLAQPVDGPVLGTVGCVVQHLGHHLPPGTSIGGPLALDKGGDAVLVQKEMIQTPSICLSVFVTVASLVFGHSGYSLLWRPGH